MDLSNIFPVRKLGQTGFQPELFPVVAEPLPKTFQDLVDAAARRSGRSEPACRVAVSQLRTMAWFLTVETARRAGRLTPVNRHEVVLAAIPCDVTWVNEHTPRYARALFRVTRKSFGNALTAYRMEMRTFGLLEPSKRPKLPPGSPWGRLVAALPPYDRRGSLRRLGTWCHFEGIPLAEMCDEVVGKFRLHVQQRMLHVDIPHYIRTAVNVWNRAVKAGFAGPTAKLLTVVRERETYTLSSINPEFDSEMLDLEAVMAGANRKGPRKRFEPAKLSSRSIKTYLYRVTQAASGLVQGGRDRVSVRLAHLVEPDAFESILIFFYERARAKIAAKVGQSPDDLPEQIGATSQTAGIGNTLIWMAKHYLKLPPDVIDDLRDRASAFGVKKPTDLHPKVRARLDQLAVPVIRARLLSLPRRLMRIADEIKTTAPEDAARTAMFAAAIEIELYCPLRLTNLTRLRIGEHVVYDGLRGRRIEKLMVPLHQTKNQTLYEWPLDRDAAILVERYIREFRPILAGTESTWLFPAADGSDQPRAVTTMSAAITSLIDEHVGAKVNVHLFRSFAACLLLEHSPGALNDVRLLLGHKSFETALKYYAYLRPKIVAERHAAAIRHARHDLDPLIRNWVTGKGSKL